MSILEELTQQWARTQALIDLIPAERVYVGPPNPGTRLLCIGFTSERIAHASQTSTSRYQEITVEAVAQAETPEQLEQLRDRVEHHLAAWQTTKYQAVVLRECIITISRSPQSPSQLWQGELSLTWQTVRLAE